MLASAFSYVSGWRYWSERYFVSFHKSVHNSRNLRAAFWNKNWLEYVTDCRADDNMYTAIARKVVGESARDHPERYCGSVWVHFSSKKFERIVREVMDVCLRVLKKGNKSSIARNRGHFAPVINCQRNLIFKMADKNYRSQGKRIPCDFLNNLSSVDLFYEEKSWN